MNQSDVPDLSIQLFLVLPLWKVPGLPLPDQSHASPVFYPAFSGVRSQIHSVLLPGFVSTWKLHPQHLLQLPELFSFHSFY